MKSTSAFDPENLIRIIQLLLMQLDDAIAPSHEVVEDSRGDQISNTIDSLRTKVLRLRTALSKHRAAEKRKRDLEKDNRRRSTCCKSQVAGPSV